MSEPGKRLGVTRRATRIRLDQGWAPDGELEEPRGTCGDAEDGEGRALHRVTLAVAREALRCWGVNRDRSAQSR